MSICKFLVKIKLVTFIEAQTNIFKNQFIKNFYFVSFQVESLSSQTQRGARISQVVTEVHCIAYGWRFFFSFLFLEVVIQSTQVSFTHGNKWRPPTWEQFAMRREAILVWVRTSFIMRKQRSFHKPWLEAVMRKLEEEWLEMVYPLWLVRGE